jgi:hypothetical protein
VCTCADREETGSRVDQYGSWPAQRPNPVPRKGKSGGRRGRERQAQLPNGKGGTRRGVKEATGRGVRRWPTEGGGRRAKERRERERERERVESRPYPAG